MRYKEGDRVRIKTWEEIEKEFGLTKDTDNGDAYIAYHDNFYFSIVMENKLEKLNTDRILTIKTVKEENNQHSYKIKELDWGISDEIIKELVEEIYNSILSRFEILDIRND